MRETGRGSNGTAVINWVALVDTGSNNGLSKGIISFENWAEGVKCKQVTFSQPFIKAPSVFVTVVHPNTKGKHNAMNVWVDNIKNDEFKVCMRESTTFDGVHKNLKVNWFAFDKVQRSWNFTESHKIVFNNNKNANALLSENNKALCQVINFTNVFYQPPVVIISPITNSSVTPASCNAVSTWIEEITNISFRLCMKDIQSSSSPRDLVTVQYVVIGVLDPCINVTCDNFAVCKAFAPFDARCVCVEDCPSYDKQVCSSNATTFKNKCTFELEVCKTSSNHTLYHPGSCTGFPIEKGRTTLKRTPAWAESVCERIKFRPYTFYPDKRVHVQASINHWNTTDAGYVHDASVVWVQNVNFEEFTVCVTQAGRNDRPSKTLATIDWVAYQGAPPGGVTDRVKIPDWWTGSTCKTINLPQGKFRSEPTVFVTAEHISAAFKHDAATVWSEDVSASSFKICLRELQEYDGFHQNIHVNWLAFEDMYMPIFAEKDSVYFPNSSPPKANDNGAFCKDIKFSRSYDNVPTVLVSANHTANGGNLDPDFTGMCPWIEYMNETRFRLCVKMLHAKKHDPLTVSYTVLSDACSPNWSYYHGVCYYTSDFCKNWWGAVGGCRDRGSNLVTIRSQEENVYIQNRHNGGKSWIGLNDRVFEGHFNWSGGVESNFTYWVPGQPNNLKNQDCVHTLGVNHKFEWNDISCSDCRNYTCSKDFDECSSRRNKCHRRAKCSNLYGSYSCKCQLGYSGDGVNCTDIDECSAYHMCDSSATCRNTEGSYTCRCNAGYSGDGKICRDLDECSLGSYTCDPNANCNNTAGSYTCTCRPGYTGNGQTCTRMTYRGLVTSAILGNNARYQKQLASWLSPVLRDSSRSRWVRCWSGKSDGFAASTFHSRCNNRGPTVTIVQVGSYVFGGYTDQSWTSAGGYCTSYKSFLFTLYNTYGYKPQKRTMYRYLSYAIYGGSGYGPTFGAGHDLYIRDHANHYTGSYTNSGYSYYAPYGCPHGGSSCSVLAGSYSSFILSDIEVFYEST